jgi:hypothetical protein
LVGTVILNMTAKRKILVLVRNQIHPICCQPFYWINCPHLQEFSLYSLWYSYFNLLDNIVRHQYLIYYTICPAKI